MKNLLFIAFSLLGSFLTADDFLSGTVTSTDGTPLQDIRITDGFTVSMTKTDGTYRLARNPRAVFVSVILPSDKALEPFYKKIAPGRDNGYDFTLKSRPRRDAFAFIQISDHESTVPFLDYLKDIRERALHDKAAFIVSTGDLCHAAGVRQQAIDMTSKNFGGIRAYLTLGNHDLDGQNGTGEADYQNAAGPTRYAFEEGNVLFMSLPMPGGDKKPSYTMQDIAQFVHELLKSYPKNKQLFILTHFTSPYINRSETLFHSLKDYALDMSERNLLGVAYGHTHWYNVWNGKRTRFWNTGQSRTGGGGNAPASYRIFNVSPDGAITSELVETNVKPFVHIACNPKTGLATAVAFASALPLLELKGTLNGQDISFNKTGRWLWTAHIAPTQKKDIDYNLTARFGNDTVLHAEGVCHSLQAGFELKALFTLPGSQMHGTPLLVGNMLFSGTCDDENGTEGSVFAFDISTGKLAWQTKIGYGIRNNLLLHDGVIYAVDAWNNVFAIDAITGNILNVWKDTESVAFENNYYGAPAMDNGRLFAGCGSSLKAIDITSGKILWKSKEIRDVFGSTMPIVARDGKLFIAINWGFLNCLDAQTGKLLWTTRRKDMPFMFQPTFCFLDDGSIFLQSGRFSTEIIDADSGETRVSADWKDIPCRTSSIPLLFQNRLYWGTMSRSLVCADAQNLKPIWSADNLAKKSYLATCQYAHPLKTMEASPILLNGKIIAAFGDGNIHAIDPQNGKSLAAFDVGAPILTTPVAADGNLLVLDYAGRLFILSMPL